MGARQPISGPHLGVLLFEARRAAGLTQEQVAENLSQAGEPADKSSVSRSEAVAGPGTLAKAQREALARGYRLSFVLTPLEAIP